MAPDDPSASTAAAMAPARIRRQPDSTGDGNTIATFATPATNSFFTWAPRVAVSIFLGTPFYLCGVALMYLSRHSCGKSYPTCGALEPRTAHMSTAHLAQPDRHIRNRPGASWLRALPRALPNPRRNDCRFRDNI